MVCWIVRSMYVWVLGVLFLVNASYEVSFNTLDEVFQQFQKDLVGYDGCVDIVSKLYMTGSPVKSQSNCYMMSHPKSKGLSKEDVQRLCYLFKNLQPGADSNLVSLGSFTYKKVVVSSAAILVNIKVERSEL